MTVFGSYIFASWSPFPLKDFQLGGKSLSLKTVRVSSSSISFIWYFMLTPSKFGPKFWVVLEVSAVEEPFLEACFYKIDEKWSGLSNYSIFHFLPFFGFEAFLVLFGHRLIESYESVVW